MRINDIIVDHAPLDEGIADTVKKVSTGIGNVLGGARGAWDAAKQGFASGRAAVAGSSARGSNPQIDAIIQSINKLSAQEKKQLYAQLANPSATVASAAPVAAAPAASATPQATPAPAATPAAPAQEYTGPNWDGVTGAPLSPKAKAEYEKFSPEQKAKIQQNIANQTAAPAPGNQPAATPPAAPQGSTYDPAKAAAEKAAKGQADQQQAQQQMAATKAANAAKSQQDAAIKAAADAAKAKPGFQQTAADKLAIKTAADKGIREADEKKKKKLKKKVVAEFNSRFLGMMI